MKNTGRGKLKDDFLDGYCGMKICTNVMEV